MFLYCELILDILDHLKPSIFSFKEPESLPLFLAHEPCDGNDIYFGM